MENIGALGAVIAGFKDLIPIGTYAITPKRKYSKVKIDTNPYCPWIKWLNQI